MSEPMSMRDVAVESFDAASAAFTSSADAATEGREELALALLQTANVHTLRSIAASLIRLGDLFEDGPEAFGHSQPTRPNGA